jgi:hypothetical protein
LKTACRKGIANTGCRGRPAYKPEVHPAAWPEPPLRQAQGRTNWRDAVMKVRMAVLATAATLLAACASTGGEKTSYAPQAKSVPETRVATDDAYMARVEFLARRRGINLTWVNPPTRIEQKK